MKIKKHWLAVLCLLMLAVAVVLAGNNCPTKAEYRVMIKDAVKDYFANPTPEKLMGLRDMLKIYATHDFTKCLEEEEEEPEEDGEFAELNKSEIREAIDLIVEADRVLAQNAVDFAKSLTVLNPDNQDEFDEQILKAEEEMVKAESFVSANQFQRAITHFKLAWKHAQTAIKIANESPEEGLTCNVVRGGCDGVSVFKMKSLTNSHAQLQGDYAYTVCCRGVSGLGTDSDGSVVLALKELSNSHVQKRDIGTYTYKVYLSAPDGITCDYVESNRNGYAACENAGFDTCLASMQSNGNSHIGDCKVYNIKICCKTE